MRCHLDFSWGNSGVEESQWRQLWPWLPPHVILEMVAVCTHCLPPLLPLLFDLVLAMICWPSSLSGVTQASAPEKLNSGAVAVSGCGHHSCLSPCCCCLSWKTLGKNLPGSLERHICFLPLLRDWNLPLDNNQGQFHLQVWWFLPLDTQDLNLPGFRGERSPCDPPTCGNQDF